MLERCIMNAREHDFAEFVQFADNEELAIQRELIADTLDRPELRNVRTNVTDLLRERQMILDQALELG